MSTSRFAACLAAGLSCSLATAADPEGALANLKLIHSFTEIEGAGLGDRLAVGPDGKLYGSAGGGGEHGYGTTFRALPGGKVTRLFSFGAPDTTMVVPGPLTLGGDDRFYGIVKGGGSGRGWGGVFRMNTRGDVEQLHDFTGDTCAYPLAPLAEGSDGNFYGSTSQGGDGGCLFRISPHGRYTLLRMLTTSDGVYPLGPLVESSDGFFYGVLMQLGPRGGGTAFRMSRQGRLHVIHAFERPFDAMVHGGGPYYPVSLLEAPDGFFYGSTQAGGQADQGTVFRMTREGQVDVLHDFANSEDGALPIGLLRLGADGALYGLTLQGGAHGKGTAYRLTLGGEFSVLHAFNPARDEDASSGGLTELAPGIFYGVNGGGIDHLGALYRLRLK